VTGESRRFITVYVAHDTRPKPVVILIPGSGCAPLVTIEPDGSIHDTTLFADIVAPRLDRLHFAIVAKRGVDPLVFPAGLTEEDKEAAFRHAEKTCSAEYFESLTKEARVSDVVATAQALSAEPWADGVMLAGHSEGTDVATGAVRALDTKVITAAGLFASAGPVPFYGGYVAGGGEDRTRFQSTFDRMRMLQRADDDFMYEGLPARRWKTFWLNSTPMEDVRDSLVPLFVAQGTRDGSPLSADLFALEAIRQQPTRPIRYEVVQQGDHAFENLEGKSFLAELFDDFGLWAHDPHRQTSVVVLR